MGLCRSSWGGTARSLFHLSKAGVILRRFFLFGRTSWTWIRRLTWLRSL